VWDYVWDYLCCAVAKVGGEKPGLGWRDGTVVVAFMFPFKRASLLKPQATSNAGVSSNYEPDAKNSTLPLPWVCGVQIVLIIN
jgi:hypothetical protein